MSTPNPDLFELMKVYARWGLADWNKNVPDSLRRRASFCLANKVANEHEANGLIEKARNGGAVGEPRFIPMPYIPANPIGCFFFLPVGKAVGQGQVQAYFDMVQIVDEKNSLGFRFEPADPPNQAHGYGHVQMCRKMHGGNFEVQGIPGWVPESYPAFSIATSVPIRMFLSMGAAVHGHHGGMKTIVQELFRSSPGAVATYLLELEAALGFS